MTNLKVDPIRAFRDNYIWCIHDGTHAAVVDPGDAEPVKQFLAAHALSLSAILITHHHPDHVGGVRTLLDEYNVPVFGPAKEKIPGITRKLGEGDKVTVPELDLPLTIVDIPGHTAGHIGYIGDGMLFCGDTLFSCGCGRLFEGTPEQMYASLGKLAALPEDTLVYCTHEYTLSNLRFAHAAEPGSKAITDLEQAAQAALERNMPSLPSTIGAEKAANPFLRAHVPALAKSAEAFAGHSLDGPVEVFAALRNWKDHF